MSSPFTLNWADDGHDVEKTNSQFDSLTPDYLKHPHKTGTTLMAASYDGGIMIAADTRTSTGSYVAGRLTDKLTKLTDKIYCCRSGSSADTQAIAAIVKYHLSFYEEEIGEPASVGVAANIFRDLIYQYKYSLTAGIIVAGWDKRDGGQIYSISLGGMLKRLPVAFGGSGSVFIMGYVDSNFKPNMTRQECRDFLVKGITLAIHRDGSSGGCARLANICESGVEREDVIYDDFPPLI
uniref:proteasome endopeptidase complex n=1 Tax=Tetranychus truncatus TaxID=93132 RepID=A0A3G5AP35_9ACAR|nr:proteasome subunit beta type-6 [Tetranychus truncatus]